MRLNKVLMDISRRSPDSIERVLNLCTQSWIERPREATIYYFMERYYSNKSIIRRFLFKSYSLLKGWNFPPYQKMKTVGIYNQTITEYNLPHLVPENFSLDDLYSN